jgi:hypothetical protein
MPLTIKECDQRDQLAATAAGFGVPGPLSGVQAQALAELLPYLAGVPDGMRGGVVRHVLIGARTGDFLTALFSHDLAGALLADDDNYRLLRYWMQLLHNATPGDCHGSRTKVAIWVARGGLAGPVAATDSRDTSAAPVAA